MFDKFKAYKALVENQTGMKIKTLQFDNGGEFVSKKFDDFLHECGIERQTSAPYTPQQNGVTERTNRTMMECARSMIRAQGVELEFWAEAMNTAVYIKNRCPTKALDSKTPQEAWIGTKPDVFHLRAFGCKTFAHIPNEKRSKLESKSIPCVFLGYCERTKTYSLMCLETKRIIKSRDVVFLEGTEEVEGVRDKRPLSNQIEHLVVDEVDELVKDVNLISLKARPTEDVEGDESTTNSSSEEEFASSQDEGLNEPQQDDQEKGPKDNVKTSLMIGGWPPKRWNEPPWHFRKNPKPWKLNGEDAKKWEITMQEEYDSLLINNTWSLVPFPKGRKPISCKWVFKLKHGVDGEIERYKARLVARGFTQKLDSITMKLLQPLQSLCQFVVSLH